MKHAWLYLILTLALLNVSFGAGAASEQKVRFISSGDIIYFDNATKGLTVDNRSNDSITKLVVYWSFDATNCDVTEIESCDLFNAENVFNQVQRYNASFNYYIPDERIYRFVKDSDISWSSRKLNPVATAVRLGYLNQTWAQAKANKTGLAVYNYARPTTTQYRALAKLLATMNLVWGYRIDEIMFYNQINPYFPSSDFNMNSFNAELEPYHLAIDRNNNVTFCFGG